MCNDQRGHDDEDGGEYTLDPTHDLILQGLADSRRRLVLYFLKDSDAEIARLDDIVDFVSAVEDVDENEEARAMIETNLYHHQLPQLADCGAIDFEPRSRAIRYRGGGVAEDILELIEEREWTTRE